MPKMTATTEEAAVEVVQKLHPEAEHVEAYEGNQGPEKWGWWVLAYRTEDAYGRDTVDDGIPEGRTALGRYFVAAIDE